MRFKAQSQGNSSGSVLVVGAAGGIGAAAVRRLSEQGHVVVACVHRPRPPDDVADHVIQLDVCDDASVAAAYTEFERAAGHVPLLGVVYAAGVSDLGSVEHAPAEVLEQVLAVNVVGAGRVCRAFLPRLRADGGRIVLVGSLSGRLPHANLAAYSASKAALAAWADALRDEVAHGGVRVVLIEPGAVRTGLAASLSLRPDDVAPASPYGAAVRECGDTLLRDAQRGLAPEEIARAISAALLDANPPERIAIDGSPIRTRLRLLRAAARDAATSVRGGAR